jgi:outer membrane lipoprotein carrier protein
MLNYIKLLIVCFFICNVSANITAESLKKDLSLFRTISSSFTQLTLNNHSKIIEKSEGKVLLKKPNSVYWHTILPNEQIIIKNNTKLWIYDVDLEQVTIQNIKSIQQFNILNLLLDNDFNYNEHFNISLLKQNKIKKYILKPIVGNFDFSRLVIIFDHNKLNALEIYDNFDSKIDIKFSKIKYNLTIPDKKFSYKVSDGVDVIRQ